MNKFRPNLESKKENALKHNSFSHQKTKEVESFYMKYTLPLLHIEERVLESREREGKNNDISDKTLKLNKLFCFI